MNYKRMVRNTFAFIGFAIALNGIILFFNSTFNLGNVLTIAFGLVLMSLCVFYDKFSKLIKIIVSILLGLAVALSSFLLIYGVSDNVNGEEDVVIVLGAGLKGKSVTYSLADRLNKAVEYSQENPDAFIVVSGGQGFQEDISEAEAMEKYLIARGVKAEKIIKEDKSTSTFENFTFSKKLLDEKFGEDYEVAYITNEYHIYRAGGIARNVGMKNPRHIHSSTRWYTIIPGVLRECLAVAKFAVFGN